MRALVVDDDDFTRFLLVRTLASLGAMDVRETNASSAALRLADEAAPDLAILDLDLGPGPTGIDLAHGLRRLRPTIAIVVLSSYTDPRLMGVNRELPLGAVYLSKRDIGDADTLRTAIERVLNAPLGRRATDSSVRSGDGRRLSDSQVEVMRMIAQGYSNAEIARRRTLTEAAVEKAITRLIRQLDLIPGRGDNLRVLITQAYFERTGATQVRRD